MRAFSVRCAGQPHAACTRAVLAKTAVPSRLRAAAAHPCARPRLVKVHVSAGPHAEEEGLYVDLTPGFAFYKVEAVIRPWRLQHVVKALSEGGIRGLTTYDVRGLGAQGGSRERYAGHEFDEASLVDKVKCEVVVVAGQVNDVVSMIIGAAQTGEYGDGKLFISPVCDVIRIRTAEHGAAAERMKGGREDMKNAAAPM